MMKRFIQLLLIAILWVSTYNLQATEIMESSAVEIALNGLSILHQGASLYANNPVAYGTGAQTTYQVPYSMKDIYIYGAHSAIHYSLFSTAAGTVYQYHQDYRYSDYYLNLQVGVNLISCGVTQHFVFEEIPEIKSYYEPCYDWGIRTSYKSIVNQLIFRKIGAENNSWQYSVASGNSKVMQVGIGCGKTDGFPLNYQLGTTIQLMEGASLMTSWQSSPSRFGAGLSLKFGKTDLTYGVRTHPELDLTHAIDIGYAW